MRHTEFWARMEAALGAGYAPVWARSQVVTALDGRTVAEALEAGVPPRTVWRAVADVLEAPGVAAVRPPADRGGDPEAFLMDEAQVAVLQRRTVVVLVASQSFGGLGTTVGVAVAAVLAERVSGSEALAGLVQTMQVLGAAVASSLVARVMGARGRRPGLVLGYLLGAAGAAVCVIAGTVGSFALLVVGAFLLGSNTAANYQSRYAAADLAPPAQRARALSTVLWATTVGAVLGPNLVGPAGRLAGRLGLPPLTGPFLVSAVVVLLAAALVTTLMRPDPLLVARALAEQPPDASLPVPGAPTASGWRRTLLLARRRPRVGAAVLAMSAGHAVMVAVMVMTPLHMDHGGADLQVIGLVISVHVLGMFFFSPVVGLLTDRLGRPAVLGAGAVILWVALAAGGTAPEGASVRITVGLFLLGLGWSCCSIASATLLTEATPLEDRTAVQGTADLVMNVSAAAAGALGGVVVAAFGFGVLSVFAAVLVTGVVAAAAVARREERREPATPLAPAPLEGRPL